MVVVEGDLRLQLGGGLGEQGRWFTGGNLGVRRNLWKLAVMLIWKGWFPDLGAGSGVPYTGHAGPGPRESTYSLPGWFRGIRGAWPCERHVGGDGLAPGAIPIGDDVGNDLLHKLCMGFHRSYTSLSPWKWAPDRDMPRVQSATNTASPAYPLTPIPVFPTNCVASRLRCPDPACTLDR